MADVLSSGDDRPPRPFPRRTALVLAVVLLAGAAVAGVLELRERRAAAALDRRLDRVVDLDVEPRSSSSSYDPATRSLQLDLQVRLRNDGPRTVAVERGQAGAYALVQTLVEVASGEDVPLLLRRTLTCSPTAPPPPAPLDVLVLDLRTAAGPRTVELPLDPSLLTDEAPRACGFLPLEEAVDVQVRGVTRSPRGVLVTLEVRNRSARGVSLVSLDPGEGLLASSPSLPLRLAAQSPDALRSSTLEVVVSVEDCAAARTSPPQLVLLLRDDRGRVAQPVVGYGTTSFGGLLADSCSG